MTYTKFFVQPKFSPQSEQIPGREAEMVANGAGGFAFQASNWTRLKRFLMLGTEGRTFYESEKELTLQNAKSVIACITEDGRKVVNNTVIVSTTGAPPSNSPAIFVLALCFIYGDLFTRRAVAADFSKVVRTGTHLFEFCETMKLLGKNLSSQTVQRAISSWYLGKTPRDLAYQITKYQNRNGWSHADVLRMSHVNSQTNEYKMLFQYILGKDTTDEFPKGLYHSEGILPGSAAVYLTAVEAVKRVEPESVRSLILNYKLPREVIPTQHLNRVDVWEALLQDMPYMAMVRNLGKMSKLGMFEGFSDARALVAERLQDAERIHKSKISPLDLLLAFKTYQQGHGERGTSTWPVSSTLVAALESGLQLSFDMVEPSNKNLLIAVDVSGSMDQRMSGYTNLTLWEAAAAAGLMMLKANPNSLLIAFDSILRQPMIHSRTSLNEATRLLSSYKGGTDCAIPFDYALKNHLKVDGFMTLTDNMSWAGQAHAAQVLTEYRRFRPARFVNVMMAAYGTQLNDPKDEEAMEMAGFAPSLFNVAGAFFDGRI